MSALRPLAGSLMTQIDQTVTQPGYLVEIVFTAQTVRLSSRGTLAWGGETWLGYDIDVSGLSSDGSGEASGELRLGNTDNTLSALILGEGIANCPVRVFVFYGDAPAADDGVEMFSGIGDEAGVMADRVAIKLQSDALGLALLPRGRITRAAGFNHLTQPGTVLVWNGVRIVLEASRG